MFVWALRDKGSEWKTMRKFLEAGALPFTPLVEAVCEHCYPRGGVPGKNPVAVMTELAGNIAPLTDSGRVWVDLGNLLRILSPNDVAELHSVVRRGLGLLSHRVTPVIRASSPRAIVGSALAWAQEEESGVCIRVDGVTRLPEKVLAVNEIATASGLSESETDLIFDAQDLPRAISYDVLSEMLPLSQVARTWVVLAGSFPESITEMLPEEYEHRLERSEWVSWRDEIAQSGSWRTPLYGDYATQAGIYSPSPPFPGSPSIRYTIDEKYVVLRGRRRAGADQYVGHARYLRQQPYFAQILSTPGDLYVDRIASRTEGTGNATTWRVASLERHLHVVAAQVARFAPVPIRGS